MVINVPKNFDNGVVVPILKQTWCGDASRAVTIKLFELCLLDKFGDFLSSLQFGFKNVLGCQNASFTMHQVTNYFT